MNRHLATSIVNAIASPSAERARGLQRFRERDWHRSYHWLVTSGLALHLLAALKDYQEEPCIPQKLAARLHSLNRESANRTRELRSDFLDLNRRFATTGAVYTNWKGFALEPEFCDDIRLRPQMDFDFIVRPEDAVFFDSVLRECGYQRTHNTAIEAIYENMPGHSYALEDVYRPKPHRKVELHFAADHPSWVTPAMDLRAALDRRQTMTLAGETAPVLAREDAFLSHAAHAGRHALEGWVRLGWLHEIAQFSQRHADNPELWTRVRALAEEPNAPLTSAAVGIVLASRVWHTNVASVLSGAERMLPGSAVRWLDQYGERLAIADFPGTKLNLLLQRELCGDAHWREVERAALFRRRAVPRVAHIPPQATALRRVRAAQTQFRFTCRRICFHVVETARYYLLKWRWGRPALPSRTNATL